MLLDVDWKGWIWTLGLDGYQLEGLEGTAIERVGSGQTSIGRDVVDGRVGSGRTSIGRDIEWKGVVADIVVDCSD